MEGISTKHATGCIVGVLHVDLRMDVAHDERHRWIGDRGNESSHAWKTHCRLRHLITYRMANMLVGASPTKD